MAALITTSFLVPLFDNEGAPFPRSLVDELRRRLLELQAATAGGAGFSARPVSGTWVFEGRVFNDESIEYSIGFDSWRTVDAWFDVVRWAREAFHQEAIFVTVLGVSEALGA